jgi:hypothetical protein
LWFDSLRAFHTTDKRPAMFLVSRPYRIGYNALDDCRYRRLVLLVLLRLNSCLPPFRASVQVGFDDIQLLRYADIPHSVLNKRKESDIPK